MCPKRKEEGRRRECVENLERWFRQASQVPVVVFFHDAVMVQSEKLEKNTNLRLVVGQTR